MTILPPVRTVCLGISFPVDSSELQMTCPAAGPDLPEPHEYWGVRRTSAKKHPVIVICCRRRFTTRSMLTDEGRGNDGQMASLCHPRPHWTTPDPTWNRTHSRLDGTGAMPLLSPMAPMPDAIDATAGFIAALLLFASGSVSYMELFVAQDRSCKTGAEKEKLTKTHAKDRGLNS
jgi:hypothetical protein